MYMFRNVRHISKRFHHSIAILHNFVSYCGNQFEVDSVLTRYIAAVLAIISFWGSFEGFYSK